MTNEDFIKWQARGAYRSVKRHVEIAKCYQKRKAQAEAAGHSWAQEYDEEIRCALADAEHHRKQAEGWEAQLEKEIAYQKRIRGPRSISPKLRFEILSRDGFRCRYCGATPQQADLRVDHIHPVAAGGGSEPENLVTACHDCNAGKSDMVGVQAPQ